MLRRSGVRAQEVCPGRLQGFHGLLPIKRRISKRLLTITGCFASEGEPRLLQGTLRVFAVSDLHTHHAENLNWVRQLSTTAYPQDVLIVAGDISDDLEDIRITLAALKERFAVVFFCPGNHELWVTAKQRRHDPAAAATAAAGAPQLAAAVPAPPAAAASRPAAATSDYGQPPAPHPSSHPQRPHPQSPQLLPDPAASAPSTAAPAAARPTGSGGQPLSRDAPERARTETGATAPRPAPPHPHGPAPFPPLPRDSVEKLAQVMLSCEELGVVVTPARLGRLRVVPLLAWHHKAFDAEPDIPGIPRASALTISDYARCIWPDRIWEELQRLQPSCHNTHPQQPPQPGAAPESFSGCSSGSAATTATAIASTTATLTAAAAAAADWGDGGHGSSAVAAWFDSLNDLQPPSWRRGGALVSGSDGTSDSSDRCGSASQRTNCSGSLLGSCKTDSRGRSNNSNSSSSIRAAESADVQPGGEAGARGTTGQDSGRSSRSNKSSISSSSSRSSSSNSRSADGPPGVEATPPQLPDQRTGAPGCGSASTAGSPRGGPAPGSSADDLITFSHFLPLQGLLPEKRYLTFPNLAKAVGSTFLGQRVRRLRPQVHVFGHTHFAWDAVHDGIRYLQAPLAYPSERRFRLRSLILTAAGSPPAPAGRLGGPDAAADHNGAAAGGSPAAPEAAPVATTVATTVAAAGVDTRGRQEEEVDDDEEAELDPRWPPLAPAAAVVAAAPPEQSSSPDALQGGGSQRQHHQPQPQPQQQDQRQEQQLQRQEQQLQPQEQQLQRQERPLQRQGQQPQHPAEQRHGEGLSAPWPSGTDPRDAGWLPLCIYRAEYTVRLCAGRRGTTAAEGNGQKPPAAPAAAPAARLLLRPSPVDAHVGAGSGTAAGGKVPQAGADEEEELEVVEWRSQWCPEQAAMWSGHYKRHPRRPQELQLAPWVADRYSRRMRRNIAKWALGAEPPAAAAAAAAATPAPAPPLATAAAVAPEATSSYGGAVAPSSSSGLGPGSSAKGSGRGGGAEDVNGGAGDGRGGGPSGEGAAGDSEVAAVAMSRGGDALALGGSVADADAEEGAEGTVEETELE